MPFDYPTDISREQAFLRRADKCIEIITLDGYSIYRGQHSIEKLAHLIKLIIWALEPSLPRDVTFSFLHDFKNLREQILDVFENEEIARANYVSVVAVLLETLKEYKSYIINISPLQVHP